MKKCLTSHWRYKFDKIKQFTIDVSENIRVLVIYRGNYKTTRKKEKKLEVKEFTVCCELLINDEWQWIRRHCWMTHSKNFHTHIRLGISKRKQKIIHHNWKRTIISALNWSKKDMLTNWSNYYIAYFRKIKSAKMKQGG